MVTVKIHGNCRDKPSRRRRNQKVQPSPSEQYPTTSPAKDHTELRWTGQEGALWVNDWHQDQRGPMVVTMQTRQANPSWWRTKEDLAAQYGKSHYTDPDDQLRVQDILDEFDDLLGIATSHGNWDFNPYLCGMANGMILMRAIIAGEDPEYMEAPNQWGEDLYEERKALEADALERSVGFRDGVQLARDIADY